MTKANQKKSNITAKLQSPTNLIVSRGEHAVPDVTILDNQMMITPTTRKTVNFNDKPSKSNNNYAEGITKPSVPDLTILDDEPKVNQVPVFQQRNRIFDADYKQMLIDSHGNFMKQMRNDENQPPAKDAKRPTNNHKSNLFNMKQYQENPLRKYAPKPTALPTWNDMQIDLDSSSILVDDEPQKNTTNITEETCDDTTFKKVAEMLNQIQKLTTTPTKPAEPKQDSTSSVELLRLLANKYLTKDELLDFDVEYELKELEQNEIDLTSDENA